MSLYGLKKDSSPPSSQFFNNKSKWLKTISKWNIDSTVAWLKSVGYEDCESNFRSHGINGRALLMLDEHDLKEIIKNNVGQRKNLYHLIRMLQISFNRSMNKSSKNFFVKSEDDEEDGESDDDGEKIDAILDEDLKDKLKNVDSNEFLFKRKSSEVDEVKYGNDIEENDVKVTTNNLTARHLINESHKESNASLSRNGTVKNNVESDADEIPNFCENCLKKFDNSPYVYYSQNNNNLPIRTYKGEKRKTLVGIVYLFMTCLWTSFMLTVVHDRVPDMQKYPPLPDIILDNLPLIPWAFFAAEAIAIILLFIFSIILVFHKFR